ncbi:MAG: ATP-binding cassette domain-containing protein [Burkholderiales bacterium]|nr:ATP-binding cassette domain-containing protein [Burkholderiales bacterium]
MILLKQLSLYRGSNPLLANVDLVIHDGQKIGITGANGGGKSSFFAMLKGELHQDSGELEIPRSAVIAHVEQEVEASGAPAVEYVIDGDAELRILERAIAGDIGGEALAHAVSRLDEIDGYGARARAARLMHGLGFRDHEIEKPVSEFSGGWRMRLNLARALMCRSDILLLDEPTNHLDLEAVIWLESWLKSYEGTLLLISHDREFLDATVRFICHLENKMLRLYSGNYGDFERQRAANLAQQQAAFEKQQREVAHLQSYIDRFRAKATKARQAQSRIKALERMEMISAAHIDSPFHFSFDAPVPASDPLLKLDKAAAGYGARKVFEGITLVIESGNRIGLIGPNGAGKSTLVKLIAGELAPLSGERIEGRGLRIGYFAQHQLESLKGDESPLQHLQRLDEAAREQELRNYLGGFGFAGDAVFSPVGNFSGGEKARLSLALIIRTRPNLLLLDEPTNHLDLEMRHALTMALQDFEGALVLVSHDRHLIRTTTDQLVLVESGKAGIFEGDIEDYGKKVCDAPGEKKPDAPNRKQVEAQSRAARRPLQKRIDKLEDEMEKLSEEKSVIEARIADPEFYSDRDAVKSALLRQARIESSLAEMENEWLELHSELESLQ